mgnify:CR=1 FL=1
MKVILVNPRVTDVSTMPLGILYIAAVLEKEGHTVLAYDPLVNITNDKVVNKILSDSPAVVGLSISTAQFARGLDLAKKIKAINPKIKIVVGGVHISALPLDVMEYDCFDFAIFGEGEITMKELCRAIENGGNDFSKIAGLVYRKDGRIMQNEKRELIKNLDELPLPARHLLPAEWYLQPPGKIRGYWLDRSITLMASRGCPYHCIYCGSHIIFGRTPRYRSPEKVVEEIEYLMKEYGVQGAWFNDDELTVNEDWLNKFCDILIEKGINFKWSCQARVNQGSVELMKKMKKSGCIQIDYGVESGSQRILNVLKKGTTIEQIKKKFKETKEIGIRTGASNVLGAPTETTEDIQMSIDLINEIKPDFADFYYLTPFPGTEFYEMAIKNKWMAKDDLTKGHWLFSRVIDLPTISLNMPKEELAKVRSKLNNICMKRNYQTYFSSPDYVLKLMAIMANGLPGLPKGIKRFLKTGKIDAIAYAIFEYRRNHTYPPIFN